MANQTLRAPGLQFASLPPAGRGACVGAITLLLEPLAQAMAALTDETWQTLAEIDRRSQEQAEKFSPQISMAAQSWKDAAAHARTAAHSLNQAGARIE